MSYSPDELTKRSDAFGAMWKNVMASPSTDALLEFAVSISSFTEFLHSKGLAGLHQISRSLEQQVLSLFDGGSSARIPQGTLDDLNTRVQKLSARVTDFIQGNSQQVLERRAQRDSNATFDVAPSHRVWVIGAAAAPWKEFMVQLGYFGIHAEFHQGRRLPDDSTQPTIVLMDAAGMTIEQIVAQVEQLRARFATSTLIVHKLPSDFESLKAVLAAGCDFCFSAATPLPVVMAKFIELCSSHEEAPYRALIVEDSLTARKSIERTLAMCGIETHSTSNPHEVLDCLTRFQPDLILMDMFMPDCTGVEATRVIRQHPEFLSIPIVYLSGDTNVPMQVEALRLGGDQFLTKPFNPVVLNAIVQSKIERYRALSRAMLQDSLTGLFNHNTSKEKLAGALRIAVAEQQPLSVAMIDIDHFKKINDSYGHQMGDQVIRSLAWFLRQRLRKADLIGRYGGEEFLLVLPRADADQAADVLDRIRHDFSQIKYPFNETSFNVTVSGGIAQLQAQLHAQTSAESLIKQADEALYQAKHAGRNRLVKSG
jgi:diguanylate cyclase (GGDEF)-like protein